MKFLQTMRLLLLTSLLFSCSTIWSEVPVPVGIPPRPKTIVCPDKPIVTGDVVSGNVIIPMNDALKLKEWMDAYMVCAESNQTVLGGHIEKLENRLKAVGGQ